MIGLVFIAATRGIYTTACRKKDMYSQHGAWHALLRLPVCKHVCCDLLGMCADTQHSVKPRESLCARVCVMHKGII